VFLIYSNIVVLFVIGVCLLIEAVRRNAATSKAPMGEASGGAGGGAADEMSTPQSLSNM